MMAMINDGLASMATQLLRFAYFHAMMHLILGFPKLEARLGCIHSGTESLGVGDAQPKKASCSVPSPETRFRIAKDHSQ